MKKLTPYSLLLLIYSASSIGAENESPPVAQVVKPPVTSTTPAVVAETAPVATPVPNTTAIKAQSPEYAVQPLVVQPTQLNQSLLLTPNATVGTTPTAQPIEAQAQNQAITQQLNNNASQLSAQSQMQQQLLQQPPTQQYMEGKDVPLPTPTVGSANGSVAAAAKDILLTLSPDEIKELKIINERIARANAIEPVSFIPRVTSISTDLSAGSALPVVRVAPNQATFIIFEDITGQPWPLAAAPINPQPSSYYVSWFDATPTVYVQPQVSYGQSSIGVMLKDLPTPLNVMLENGEPESIDNTRTYDARISIRIPIRGPNAKTTVVQKIEKIALYDEDLQAFLDGVPPPGSIAIKTNNPRVEAWKFNNKMVVRTPFDSRTMYSKTLASSDGTRVYEMSLSPIISMTSNSETINVSLEL